MALRFGTDGVRGLANQELTPAIALALGRAAAEVLEVERVVVGRDTRRSGPMLEGALVAGLCSAGADVELLGVVPTPAVAWAAADRPAAGAMISASHNPFPDNGIKLFAPGGLKLSDEVEARIEARYQQLLADPEPGPVGDGVGTVVSSGGIDGWATAIGSSVGSASLRGLTVVIDTGHGAATDTAGPILTALGAEVHQIGAAPDGSNINDGYGSTAPDRLAAEVVRVGADAGLAFDGDADRLIAVDETGAVVDGDRVLAVLATDWAAAGRLRANTVVVTVMSNLGFHLAMREAGIEVVSTGVGDRYVLEALDDGELSLGGEQSGHVICRDLATTGDGILTGVQLLDALGRSGHPLSKLASEAMTTVPQVLRNVRLSGADIDGPGLVDRLSAEVSSVTDELGTEGRVLVRASGTEPLVRIMVEHLDPDTAERSCQRLVAAAERVLSDPHD